MHISPRIFYTLILYTYPPNSVMWWSKSHLKPAGKTALILGASQGVGADIALRLYEQECSVILVARTESKLKQQVARIVQRAGEKANSKSESSIEYYVCDAADYELTVVMWSKLMERDIDPDFVFCCAGSSIPKLFGDLTGKELSNGMNINYNTAINTVHAGHKAVLAKYEKLRPEQHKKRHLVLFSSTVASYPFIGYAQYAPSKAAITSLSIILRQELGPFNYRVSCVFPGNFESEGYAEEQLTKPEITKTIEGPSKPILSLECCDMVLDKLSKGYDSVYTDFIGWVLASLVLGVNPRYWGFFQVLVSLIFLIVAPVANYVVYLDVKKFYAGKKDSTREQTKTK